VNPLLMKASRGINDVGGRPQGGKREPIRSQPALYASGSEGDQDEDEDEDEEEDEDEDDEYLGVQGTNPMLLEATFFNDTDDGGSKRISIDSEVPADHPGIQGVLANSNPLLFRPRLAKSKQSTGVVGSNQNATPRPNLSRPLLAESPRNSAVLEDTLAADVAASRVATVSRLDVSDDDSDVAVEEVPRVFRRQRLRQSKAGTKGRGASFYLPSVHGDDLNSTSVADEDGPVQDTAAVSGGNQNGVVAANPRMSLYLPDDDVDLGGSSNADELEPALRRATTEGDHGTSTTVGGSSGGGGMPIFGAALGFGRTFGARPSGRLRSDNVQSIFAGAKAGTLTKPSN
jgi:hypothetical protein